MSIMPDRWGARDKARRLVFWITAGFLWLNGLSAATGQHGSKNLSGELIIFHAGSLSVPMKEMAEAFRKQYPGVRVLREAAGSVECARKITDLHKPCDIMASADYKVIDNMLIPDYADWNIRFAGNEMCIVYTPKSRYAGIINEKNWYDILQRPGVIYGRSDPDSDPCGYRAVMTLQLAEKHYGINGLAQRLLALHRQYIRPKEVDLIALLETHSVDYIFLYRSVAVQHNLKYLVLPDEINLKKDEFADLYHTAAVDIRGSKPGTTVTMRGEPMVYGVTILRNAPNKEIALAFLQFMLSPDKGVKILEKNGQPTIITP